MKFGVFCNQYYAEDAFDVTDLFEQAAVIDEFDFDSIAVGERHLHEPGFAEPLTTLAGIGARTETVKLVTSTILPGLYHPLHLAEQLVMIDRISNGRLTFGAALGYREAELRAFDVELADRAERFIESIELLKQFLTGKSVTHDGTNWSFDEAFVSPQPIGDVPIWIGGHADIAIKRAAYRGDGWIASASSTTDDLEQQIDVYQNALEEFDRSRSETSVVLMRDCYVADSIEEARDTIRPHLMDLYRMYARWGQTYLDEQTVELDYEALEKKCVIGSPAACIEQLREYQAMGVDHVLLRCQYPGQSQASALECLRRIGNEIIPAFN